MACPNINLPEVVQQFNEVVEAFGGTALTIEEFKSSALRSQRTGLDYSAMEAAYTLYDKNNGNFLDFTPDGRPSMLFEYLVSIGDRKSAIIEKSNYYSDKYIQQHGNWISDPENYTGQLDAHGEPSIVEQKITSPLSKFIPSLHIPESFSKLLNGEIISSNQLIDETLKMLHITPMQKMLLNLLKLFNIPIKANNNLHALKFGRAATDKNGNSFIELNLNLIQKLNIQDVIDGIIHELIHAKTTHVLSKPTTEIQHQFARATKQTYDSFLRRISNIGVFELMHPRVQYALTNEREFAASIMSSQSTRNEFFDVARRIDNAKRGKFFNSLVKMINSATDAIFNTSLISTQESELNDYLKQFKDYLIENKSVRQQTFSNRQLFDIYDSIDEQAASTKFDMDDYENFEKQTQVWSIDNLDLNQLSLSTLIEKYKRHRFGAKSILDELQIRLQSIHTRDLDAATKTAALTSTKAHINAFENKQIPYYVAVTKILQYVNTEIKHYAEILEKFSNEESDEVSISASDLQFYSKDCINVYSTILKMIHEELVGKRKYVAEQYNTSPVTGSQTITVDDVDVLLQNVINAESMLHSGSVACNILTDKLGLSFLEKIGREVNSPTIMQTIYNYLNDIPQEDTSGLWRILGSAEFSNNETVRAITHKIEQAQKNTEKKINPILKKLVSLFRALKPGEKMTDLYERNSRKQFTQYLVRDLNFGQMYEDYDAAYERINQMFGLPKDNRQEPTDVEQRIKFNAELNKWKKAHVVRKFLDEYYEAYNGVPQFVKDRLQAYNEQISDIISKNNIINEYGFPDYSLLPKEEYNQLRNLIIGKRALRKEYDVYGREKQVGDPDYEIYVALKELDEKLEEIQDKVTGKTKQQRIKYAKDQWLAARAKIIEQAGGNEDSEAVKKWDRFNSMWVFKTDDQGRAIIYEEISNLLQGIDKTLKFGKKAEELNNRINQILSIYRNESGEVDLVNLPEETLKLLTGKPNQPGLFRQYDLAVREFLNYNSQMRSINTQKKNLIKKYIRYVKTVQFGVLKEHIQEVINSMRDPDEDVDLELERAYFDALLAPYGITDYEYDTFTPYRFATKAEAIDIGQYMELSPNYNWLERDRDVFLNPEYARENERFKSITGKEYNVAMIPKRKLYDNSSAFNKIWNSPTLRALYEYSQQILSEKNDNLDKPFRDDYLLGSVAGGLSSRLHSVGYKRKHTVFLGWLAEKFGFANKLGSEEEDPTRFGSDEAGDEYEESGERKEGAKKRLIRYYTNGEEFHSLPQYYTRKMQDPSMLSSNLIEVLINDYSQSLLYKERSQIRDEVETLLDLIGQHDAQWSAIFGRIPGKSSGAYKEARSQINRRLYDERMEALTVLGFSPTRAASGLKMYTTSVNLGYKPSIGLTGFFTTMWNFFVSMFGIGNYTKTAWFDAQKDLIKYMMNPLNIGNIANQESRSKRVLIAEEFNLAEQRERKYKYADRNILLRSFLMHSTFGFMSAGDFLAKTSIADAMLRSYKYVDGKFVTFKNIQDMRMQLTPDQYLQKIDQYKKAKDLYSLLSVTKNKEGVYELSIPKEYETAYRNCYDTIKADIQNTAQQMDGLPTAAQMNYASSTIWGSLFFIHRNYLQVQLQKYYRRSVYSYEQEQYVNGIHRACFEYAKELLANHALIGMLPPILTGLAVSGELGALIGASIGVGTRFYLKIANKTGHKSIKKFIDEFFGNPDDESTTDDSYRRRLHKKRAVYQVAAELLLHYIVFDILLNAMFFPYADDDDNVEGVWGMITQLMAYSLRKAELETFNQYRISDLLNTLRSVSAVQSVSDKMESVTTGLGGLMFPRANVVFEQGLWDAISDNYNNDIIGRNSPYVGWNRTGKFMWRMVPVSNLYHETSSEISINPFKNKIGGKSALQSRKYFENKVMQIQHKKKE